MLRLLSGEQVWHKRQSANESENSEFWGLHDNSNVRRAKRSHSTRGSQHAALIGDSSDGASETHVWETGKAYWLAANAPNTKHADVNAGAEPVEVMVVELEKEKWGAAWCGVVWCQELRVRQVTFGSEGQPLDPGAGLLG